MKKKLEEALRKIAELEARILALEARPVLGHVWQSPPIPYTPPAVYGPFPQEIPTAPWRNLPEINCFAGTPESEQPR